MTQRSILDEMDLPWANHNEDLETISEHKLRPLFDTSLFHFCTQDRRDKGVDLSYEVKRSNRHTGFRFFVQLKATESIQVNTDGSFSLQIATSNINYLLNQGGPAFYILYVAEKQSFFYQSMSELLLLLQSKDEEWNKQKSHTIRFEQQLGPQGFQLMYDAALQFGLMQRTLKERSAFITSSMHVQDRMTVDAAANITDDAQIREQIEKFGLALINEGHWRKILDLHKSATGHLVRSALYNLTLGVANYYGGSRLDALSFLKAAIKAKEELTPEIQQYLKYFEATVRFSVGLLNDEQYYPIVLELEASESLGLYVLLDRAKQNYMASFDTAAGENLGDYQAAIKQIISRPDAGENLILTAKCDLALFEGFNNNSQYLLDVAELNRLDEMIGPNVETRILLAHKCINANREWSKSVEDIIGRARQINNSFIYFTAFINSVKVTYQFDVFAKYFHVVKEIPGYPREEDVDHTQKLDLMQERISMAIEFFNQIGHTENVIVASSALYELWHYVEKYDEADKLMAELEDVADSYELVEHKHKLNLLKNSGTTHETFKAWVDSALDQKNSIEAEFDRLRNEMMQMDELESAVIDKPSSGNLHMELFPIGHFQFPAAQVNDVYEIIGASQEAILVFNSAFGTIMPVANILRHPVTQEGYVNGNMDNRGIESFRNIYRIRKAFYEKSFFRFSPFGNRN